MHIPIKISYRRIEKTPELENLVLIRSERLNKFCDHINRCDVILEKPNHHHRKGNPLRVRLDVTVKPRHKLVAEETLIEGTAFEEIKKTVHDAFDHMERQLQKLVEKQRDKSYRKKNYKNGILPED